MYSNTTHMSRRKAYQKKNVYKNETFNGTKIERRRRETSEWTKKNVYNKINCSQIHSRPSSWLTVRTTKFGLNFLLALLRSHPFFSFGCSFYIILLFYYKTVYLSKEENERVVVVVFFFFSRDKTKKKDMKKSF